MIELMPTGLSAQLTRLFHSAREEVIISSPYVSEAGIDVLLEALTKAFKHVGAVRFITNLSPKNVLQSATDPSALLKLISTHASTSLWHLPQLHAKVYIADECSAVVTSANLTAGGLYRNCEYGVRINDQNTVRRIRTDILDYSRLGAELDQQSLATYCSVADDLREASTKSRNTIQQEFRQRIREAEDQLIRQRLAHGPMTTVFERTILYLLNSRGPLPTKQIHLSVAEIHPDLCDNSVDRVIDGRHFGKKWKHAVRTAQSHLKARGQIHLQDGMWRLN